MRGVSGIQGLVTEGLWVYEPARQGELYKKQSMVLRLQRH